MIQNRARWSFSLDLTPTSSVISNGDSGGQLSSVHLQRAVPPTSMITTMLKVKFGPSTSPGVDGSTSSLADVFRVHDRRREARYLRICVKRREGMFSNDRVTEGK